MELLAVDLDFLEQEVIGYKSTYTTALFEKR